jgi:hypothetical protein
MVSGGTAGGMVSGTILIREEWCQEEIENIRYAIKKSRPYGSEQWLGKAVAQFGLENTMRNSGRPRYGS